MYFNWRRTLIQNIGEKWDKIQPNFTFQHKQETINKFDKDVTIARWRKTMKFRQICLFTLDSTQEIYVFQVKADKQIDKHTHTFLV